MNVVVLAGFLSHKKKLHRSGEVVELPDDVAENLAEKGIVSICQKHSKANKPAETSEPAEPEEEVQEDDSLTLPEVKPAVKKRGKK